MQKIFAVQVRNKADMAQLEEVVVGLLGGEHHRCAFLRSEDFVKLRTQALYRRARDDAGCVQRSVYAEGIKITLDPAGNACVFLSNPFEEIAQEDQEKASITSLDLGKRKRVSSDSVEEDVEETSREQEDLHVEGCPSSSSVVHELELSASAQGGTPC